MKQNLLLLLLLTTVFSVAAQTDTIAPAKTKAPSYATIYTMEGKKIKGWFYKMDNNNPLAELIRKRMLHSTHRPVVFKFV